MTDSKGLDFESTMKLLLENMKLENGDHFQRLSVKEADGEQMIAYQASMFGEIAARIFSRRAGNVPGPIELAILNACIHASRGVTDKMIEPIAVIGDNAVLSESMLVMSLLGFMAGTSAALLSGALKTANNPECAGVAMAWFKLGNDYTHEIAITDISKVQKGDMCIEPTQNGDFVSKACATPEEVEQMRATPISRVRAMGEAVRAAMAGKHKGQA